MKRFRRTCNRCAVMNPASKAKNFAPPLRERLSRSDGGGIPDKAPTYGTTAVAESFAGGGVQKKSVAIKLPSRWNKRYVLIQKILLPLVGGAVAERLRGCFSCGQEASVGAGGDRAGVWALIPHFVNPPGSRLVVIGLGFGPLPLSPSPEGRGDSKVHVGLQFDGPTEPSKGQPNQKICSPL